MTETEAIISMALGYGLGGATVTALFLQFASQYVSFEGLTYRKFLFAAFLLAMVWPVILAGLIIALLVWLVVGMAEEIGSRWRDNKEVRL